MSLRIKRIVLLALAASLFLGPAAPVSAQRRGGMRPWLERLGRLRVPGPNERNHQSVREAYRDLVKPVGPSVVRVISAGAHVAYGTVMDATGLVMTKSSELKGDGEILCQLHDGRRVPAKEVASDRDTDLALLQLDIEESMTPVSWRESPVEVGSWLACIGLGQLPIATGVVSNTPRRIPRRLAYLGVMLNNDEAPQVVEVVKDSAASRAGLAASDIVVAVAGKPVAGRESVIRAIRELRPGDSLTVKVRRNKKTADSEDDGETQSGDQDAAQESAPATDSQTTPKAESSAEPPKNGDETNSTDSPPQPRPPRNSRNWSWRPCWATWTNKTRKPTWEAL